MFSSISGNQPSASRIQPQFTVPALTQDERLKLAEILFKYDPFNLTAADARTLRKEMSRAGIWPSRAVEQTLENIGYHVNRPQPKKPVRTPAKSGDTALIAQALAPLQAVVRNYNLANMSPADEISFYNRLREAGLTK
ncbi:hypothetical protein LARV_01090 [Longilinea arvoryzae]|uniref:Uncharacterized protein n=1 Tax=Longilinea arvoryzae TaxID=360412 RepID=A0A0S7BDD6_9CHLR|nr:hypothetical protein [Longilinea arvoryzae]GAP13337.1 hypothetical protein LARV_01090 [Longilinea arvoryzae]